MKYIWSLEPKVGWDQELPPNVIDMYKKTIENYQNLHTLKFERCVMLSNCTYGLHILCDSSLVGYGFVAFAANENGSKYIFAKCW